MLLRIDPGQSATQIQVLAAQAAQARARADKESAELAVKAIDAERALADADTALAKAGIDAAIPRQHLSALDFDRFRGELERATREQALKRREFESAEAAVQRRLDDGQLEVEKITVEQRYHEAQIAASEVRADRAGIVVHGFDPWRGGRYDEGSSVQPGRRVGDVVDEGDARRYAPGRWSRSVRASPKARPRPCASMRCRGWSPLARCCASPAHRN